MVLLRLDFQWMSRSKVVNTKKGSPSVTGVTARPDCRDRKRYAFHWLDHLFENSWEDTYFEN